MKKNVMMRLASGLLVAVLLTTCAISGTFAKYVTTQGGFDSARVAKFGVTIVANGDTFAGEYATDDAGVVGTIAKSVVTANGDDLVAPGTEGDMVAMTLAGIPEVAVNVAYTATLVVENWTYNGAEYFPVYFTVDGKTYGTDDSGLGLDFVYNDVATLVANVQDAIAAYSANYAPHTDLAVESTVRTPDVSWTWTFETGHDVQDTYLGNWELLGNAAPTIQLAVVTTVTQID